MITFRSPLSGLSHICIAAAACIGFGFLIQSVGHAHEGHDHDDSAKTALAISTYPRVVAQSELYEIVGILKNDRLTIYIDSLSSNEPATGTKVAVAIGGGDPVNGEPADNRTYTVPVPSSADSESVDMVFNVTAGGADDLLIGTLNLSGRSVGAATRSDQRLWLGWLAATPSPLQSSTLLSFAIFGLGILFERFRRRRLFTPALVAGSAAVAVLVLLVAVTFRDKEGRASNAAQIPAPAAMSDAPRRLSDATAFVSKPTQRLLDIRTVAAKPET